ncbi:acyltransferase [Flavihumibacter rivuli]|uniref:acyltransferase family protein n=1 Tax=Flavihumibacter rivuli TaxID=2838156 RepID=UPI001BDEAD83|nr:acyltransferase [Flavihumibacter rivuli]ULQ58159.1 acyltransferase [Flavihumibacter rivuli]
MNKIPALDGCRGLAILLVLGHHFFGQYFPFDAGWTGVDLFFVLSGFLITSILDNMDWNRSNLLRFYRNRALRILPLYFLLLSAFFLWVFFAKHSTVLPGLQYFKEHLPSYFLLTANWPMLRNSYPPLPHLNHLWTISIEAQFYLAWPFFVHLLGKYPSKRIPLLLFSVIMVILFRGFMHSQYHKPTGSENFFNTFSRLDCFLLGTMAYYLGRCTKSDQTILTSGAGLAGLILGTYWWWNKGFYKETPFMETTGFSLVAIIYAYLIYSTSKSSGNFIGRVMQQQWLTIPGKYSYGIYLFHWLLFQSFQIPAYRAFAHLKLPAEYHDLAIGVFFTFLSFAASYLSFHCFEKYFLSKKLPYIKNGLSPDTYPI